MSAVLGSYGHEMDASYAADFGRDREPMKTTRSRHPEYRRKGSAPTRVNGMHCRRNKRWTWGSGRGARMTNLRAFASCLAAAVVAFAASAHAQVSFTLNPIANPGNPANVVSGTNYGGSVAYAYSMATTEVTNAQYVAFLNAVDPSGGNAFGLYSTGMSGTGGGITQNLLASPGARYSVRSGTPTGGPAGTAYGSMPVNNVTWFSAARFVNWLNASQPADSTSMNSGVYAVGSGTSGAIVARGATATNPLVNIFVLPSRDEWYKAAFYTGSGSTYTRYATNSNTSPTGTLTTSTPNGANANNASLVPSNVGAYVASQSASGIFDMYGNVGEMTDTPATVGSSSYVWVGGGFGATAGGWDAIAATSTRLGTSVNVSNGFRVAQVTAVPEPETITLAAFGVVGLCGVNWLKRRRKSAAQQVVGDAVLAT